jgi:hypothetical protein
MPDPVWITNGILAVVIVGLIIRREIRRRHRHGAQR